MQSVAPVYLIASDDPLLKNERSAEIVAAARKEMPDADFMMFTHSDFQSSGEANLQRLENELMDPGLFGGDRIIKIYLKELNRTAVAVLMLIAQRLRDRVVIVIDLPRIQASFQKLTPKPFEKPSKDKKTSPRKSSFEKKAAGKKDAELAVSYLLNRGAQVQIIYPPEGDQLIAWIQNRARKYTLGCTPDCARYIAACGEGNLTGIDQTLNMLGITAPNSAISIELLDKTLSQDSRFSGFEIAEAVLNGDGVRALNVLNSFCQGSGPLTEALGQIIGSLDSALTAIPRVREAHPERMQNWKDKSMFYMSLGLRTLGMQKAVQKAAFRMPPELVRYLTDELAYASQLWSSFRTSEARQALQDLCASVCNFEVMKLQPLTRE